MKAIGQYDGELQMFRQPLGEPCPAKLGFLRWLAERGALEHEACGKPSGEYAVHPAIEGIQWADGVAEGVEVGA